MKRLYALCALLPLAAAAAEMKSGPISVKQEIAPGKIHEECTRMEAGAKRRHQWKSSAPVDFNIHYHRGNDVFYPVKKDGVRADEGTFTAKQGEDYCWMWTAKDKPAMVEGRIEGP